MAASLRRPRPGHQRPTRQRRRHPPSRSRRGPQGREEVQGSGDDHPRGVLQGGTGPVELAHHRSDADHLRLLSALHQAAGRHAGQGHRPEGPPVRQPQRHRQGPRHRARGARRRDRQGAGDGRARVPRQPGRQAGSDLPREAGGQDADAVAEGHHLRRAEGRIPPPEHDDLQADGRGYGAATSWSTTRSAAASSSGRATSRRRRASRSTPTRRWRSCRATPRRTSSRSRSS